MSWLNLYGIIIITIIMIPNIIFGLKHKEHINYCTNKYINFLEQIGRYGSMFFIIFNIGILESGFRSNEVFAIWLIIVIILVLLYLICWVIYFKRVDKKFAMALAIIPSILFIVTGFMMRDYLLLISGILFSIGHIYVTTVNNNFIQ
ncbi:MAG: putative rane protein [Anaerocolumna sp.]|nr:putative rane protein [Anaerocolumna sp.]